MPSDNELLKMRSGGQITAAELKRLLRMDHDARYRAMDKMKKPEKGGTPKRIGEGMGSPGGPYTPGAKAKERERHNRAMKEKSGAAVTSKELEKQKATAGAMRYGSRKIKKKDGKPSNPHRGAYSTGGTVSGAIGGGS